MGLCLSKPAVDSGGNAAGRSSLVGNPVEEVSGLKFSSVGMKAKYVWEFIAQHGGRAALEGLTPTQVCELFLKPATEAHKCSMCEVLRLSGREDLTGVARLFISHAWQYGFLQVCDAVWAFLVREHVSEAAAGEEIIWFYLFFNSQHNLGDKPLEWWTGTFTNAIKTMGGTTQSF